MITTCNRYILDEAIAYGDGEPKGQCVRCGYKWYHHFNFALPEDEIDSTLTEIRKFQKVFDFIEKLD